MELNMQMNNAVFFVHMIINLILHCPILPNFQFVAEFCVSHACILEM